jgi:hypothetical protein
LTDKVTPEYAVGTAWVEKTHILVSERIVLFGIYTEPPKGTMVFNNDKRA